MIRLISLIAILLTFAWTCTIQAFFFHDTNGSNASKYILMHANNATVLATVGEKKPGTSNSLVDDGYESDTSKHLRLGYEKQRHKLDAAKAQGKKPTFFENLNLFKAEQAYQERLEFKQGIYANQRTIAYAQEHPAEVMAYAAGGTAIIASAAVTMPLTASLALGAGGAGLIEVGLKGGRIQSTEDLKDIGKAMVLGALPANKIRYLLPSAVVVGGLGYAFDDSTLMYGSTAIAGFGLALKGMTIAGKSVGTVLKSSMKPADVPLTNASQIGQTALPITAPAANSNVTRINQFDHLAKGSTFRAPANQTPLTHNQARATGTTSRSITIKSNDVDYRQVYMSSRTSPAGGSLTLDGGKRTLTTSGKGSDTLLIFTKNDDGRWIQSASVNPSAKGLGQRPIDLLETTERTLESYQKMKAGKATIGKEQPWIVHNSEHIWKEKIIGMPQRTGKKETLTSILNPHAKESTRIAIELAKNPEVERVFLNRGIKKASGHPIQGSNRRPDVTYITKDGRVHQIEVASASDKDRLLLQRMKDTADLLPVERQGDVKVISYKDYMRAIDK